MIDFKPTILLVDDMQVNLVILSGIFKDLYQIKRAKSGEEALEVVAEGGIDLILLDVVMTGIDGYEVCRILKSDPNTKDIPIIFVTGSATGEDEEKGFLVGAVDYVTKPFKPETIKNRVKAHIELRFRQIELETISEAMKNQNEKLKEYIAIIEQISITDGLTNIFNRRHFNETFPKIIDSAKQNDGFVCFLLMDIDHFKQYNDNYGHQAGDTVLVKFADSLKNTLKNANDLPFRLGGEEFGLIFKSETKEKAYEFANQVRQNVKNLRKEKEMTQTELALTIGHKSVSTIGKIEANLDNKHYNIEQLYKISKALNVNICEFFKN